MPPAASTKKPVNDRLLNYLVSIRLVSHTANMQVKPTLMTGRLVFMQQAFAGHAINDGYGFFISFARQVFITSSYCLHNILNIGAQHGTLPSFTYTAIVRLTCALSCLCRISQNLTPKPGLKEPRTMRFSRAFVNPKAVISTP